MIRQFVQSGNQIKN